VVQKTHFFQIIVTFFQYKINYINTKTTCNKCSFDYLHWLLNYGKLYLKNGVLLTVHTSGASPQNSASHVLTILVAQLQFLREWELWVRRMNDVFERRIWFEVTLKKETSGRLKNMRFFRHPVLSFIFIQELHLQSAATSV